MNVDERQLTELVVESRDLHADAMRGMPGALKEFSELHRSKAESRPIEPNDVSKLNQSRRELIRNLGLGALVGRGVMAGGFASLLSGIVAQPARADTATNIQIFQTASSLEVLAVATYGAALGLPFIANGNAVVKSFAEVTMRQHDEHRQAFQAQTQSLGGQPQTNPNPKYTPIVQQATPTLRTPADVVTLAATLEEVATETYLANLALLDDARMKTLMASVMGVECQHLATLRAVGALLAGGAPELIAIPTNVAALPAAAGSVAFPQPTQGTDNASPPAEGALR
ncbi:MAG: ferritin-like domain-containing protein [Chloroflexota bacterium]